MSATYHPAIFDTADEAAARAIILTNEGDGADTETRWARETPYLVALLRETVRPGPETLVLDYGCGIGRLSRALIAATGCRVLGVDISPRMRAMAPTHVGSDRFTVLAPDQFARLVQGGLRVDAALAVWVLQHCLAPADDIATLHAALAPGGRCFALNMPRRAIPARDAAGGFFWADDGADVAALLRARLAVEANGVPDPAQVPRTSAVGAWWMVLRR